MASAGNSAGTAAAEVNGARSPDGAAAEALAALRALGRGASACALPLPAREKLTEPWRGLGFNLGGTRLVSALGEVSEVIAPPRMTLIPGVQPWVLGVANLRGRLLPVFDLGRYLEVEYTAPREQWRVLVMEDGELYCGLLVEQSFGMQQFEPVEYEPPGERRGSQAAGGDDVAKLDRYLRGGFRQSGRRWMVMDIRALVREPAFFEIAAA